MAHNILWSRKVLHRIFSIIVYNVVVQFNQFNKPSITRFLSYFNRNAVWKIYLKIPVTFLERVWTEKCIKYFSLWWENRKCCTTCQYNLSIPRFYFFCWDFGYKTVTTLWNNAIQNKVWIEPADDDGVLTFWD